MPDLFIPKLVELYRQGRFPFDKLIRFYAFDQINEAVEDGEQGRTIKAVLRFPDWTQAASFRGPMFMALNRRGAFKLATTLALLSSKPTAAGTGRGAGTHPRGRHAGRRARVRAQRHAHGAHRGQPLPVRSTIRAR